MTLPAFPRFDRAEVIFSIKSFAAAMLALYVASYVGLPRPFWAVLTTYVVAHPLAGYVRSKALFRFAGTLTGCVATLVMVPAMSNAPELLTLALALWVGLCLYLSLLDRTARSYVFMLAGYTAALIGFPSVEAPQLLFETAVTRVEEIGIGILCATVVHSIVLPQGLAPTLLALLDRSLGDARQWFGDLLSPRSMQVDGHDQPLDDTERLNVDRQRLAVDITQLRLLATHVPFDTGNLRWTADAVRAMQDRIAALTPTLSAVEDRLLALVEAEGRLAPDVLEALRRTTRWLAAQPSAEAPDGTPEGASRSELQDSLDRLGELPAQADDQESASRPATDWTHALRIGLAVRLQELVAGWLACTELRRTIDAGLRGAPAPLRRAAGFGDRVLHRDRGMALLSAVAAVSAICLSAAFWIATAWPSGSVATMFAAIFCSFFATLDDPVPGINGFLKFTLLSMPISALYVLVALPLVHDFGMLVLLCAPTFIAIGCFAFRPATAPAAVAVMLGIAGTLSLHDTGSADLPAFLNSNIAQVVGIAVAVLVTRAIRSVGADWSVARIRRATWRELGTMAAAPGAQAANDAYAARMLDRISLIAPRIAMATVDVRADAARSALRDLRVGADIAALQAVRASLPRAPVASLMTEISRFYRDRHAPHGDQASPGFRSRLDGTLRAALEDRLATNSDRRHAITALVGLRRNLFPDAPAALVAFDEGVLA
jgi:uncharacterized membrane protein YccC